MVASAVYPLPEFATVSFVLLILVSGLAASIYLLFYRPVGDRKIWGFGEILAITILFVVVFPLIGALLGLGRPNEPLSLTALSMITLWQNLLFVAASTYVVMVRYDLALPHLGIRLGGWPQLSVRGALAGAVTIPLAMASERLAVFLLGLMEGPAQAAARAAAEHLKDPLRPILETLSSPGQAVWVLFLLAVIVPVGEEVFFRGLVYGGLRSRWGVGGAALASALFFTVVHLQVVHALPIFVLGVILAALYQWTGSLLPGIVTHAVNNLVAVASVWLGWGI